MHTDCISHSTSHSGRLFTIALSSLFNSRLKSQAAVLFRAVTGGRSDGGGNLHRLSRYSPEGSHYRSFGLHAINYTELLLLLLC